MVKEIIQAVHPLDVASFFEGLNLGGAFDAGHIRCHKCGDVITIDNFKAATRHGGELLFACTKQECLNVLATIEG